MKHSLNIMRFNLSDCIRPTAIFFAIYSTIVFLTALACRFIEGMQTNGSDMSILIFLFICGVVGFRYNFFFAMANNVSRRDFFLGTALSGLLPACLSAVVMMVINRLISLFYTTPTIYTLIYQRERIGVGDNQLLTLAPLPFAEEVGTILMSTLFLAVVGFAIYLIGFFLGTLFYRMNKFLKMTFWILPWVLITAIGLLWPVLPAAFTTGVPRFFDAAFGISSGNVWPALGSTLVIALALTLCGWLLTRRAVLKK